MFSNNPTYKQILQDIKCGKHTCIPDCCILFFLSQWRQFSEKESSKYWKKIDKSANKNGKLYGYIPCPNCLNKKPVNIYTCDCVLDEFWDNENPGKCDLCHKNVKSRESISIKSGNKCIAKMACKNCHRISRQICQCPNPI